jgi:hypothetical protein
MAWDALWAAAGVPTGSTNPQGNIAAPVGSMFVRSDGVLFIKLGGGNTAYGWYIQNSTQRKLWGSKFASAAGFMECGEGGIQAIAVGATTLINFPPTLSAPGSAVASPLRQYVGGYTSGVIGNSFLARLQNNVDNMPCVRIDGAIADAVEWDMYWDLLTTPRSSSIAGSTDLTTNGVRILAGGTVGANAVQAVGGTGNSDTLVTEWPTTLTAQNGNNGWAFRHSTLAGDSGWVFVTTNRVAGVYTQTVTSLSTPIAINTAYRLRARMQLVAGVPTIFASVNDGTEVAITANVGPGAALVNNPVQIFQPLASIRQLDATVKSLAFMECSLWYGYGCNRL